MYLSSQMDFMELSTAILPEFDGLQLKRRWYFEGELPYGSTMSKYYLINEKTNFLEVRFGEGDLSKTNEY